ncbi:MAG: hypothetical protein FWE06_09300 [Oscillospiraceae bacterium]|nr:hypothetical protein [Oscillospiraceae bacterium]
MNNNDFFDLQPMETYIPPSLPPLAAEKPKQLQKLPSRWQKNVAVIACAGVIGVTLLSGCGIFNSFGNVGERFFHGGEGGTPDYVVHMTEQETLGIIRVQLEAVGLNLTAEPFEYGVEVEHWGERETVELTFFDAERRVGVVFNENWRWPSEKILEAFNDEYNDIAVGVIEPTWQDIWQFDRDADIELQKEEAREVARDEIISQAQVFIDQLRADGVL